MIFVNALKLSLFKLLFLAYLHLLWINVESLICEYHEVVAFLNVIYVILN